MKREDTLYTWVDFMKIDVVEDKNNVFLKRKELKLVLSHPNISTPSKQELVKELASQHKVEEDHIVIDYIFTKRGIGESEARVKIYEEKPVIKVKKKEVKEGGEKSETQTGKAK